MNNPTICFNTIRLMLACTLLTESGTGYHLSQECLLVEESSSTIPSMNEMGLSNHQKFAWTSMAKCYRSMLSLGPLEVSPELISAASSLHWLAYLAAG